MFYLLKKKKFVLIHDGEPNLGGGEWNFLVPLLEPGSRPTSKAFAKRQT